MRSRASSHSTGRSKSGSAKPGPAFRVRGLLRYLSYASHATSTTRCRASASASNAGSKNRDLNRRSNSSREIFTSPCPARTRGVSGGLVISERDISAAPFYAFSARHHRRGHRYYWSHERRGLRAAAESTNVARDENGCTGTITARAEVRAPLAVRCVQPAVLPLARTRELRTAPIDSRSPAAVVVVRGRRHCAARLDDRALRVRRRAATFVHGGDLAAQAALPSGVCAGVGPALLGLVLAAGLRVGAAPRRAIGVRVRHRDVVDLVAARHLHARIRPLSR